MCVALQDGMLAKGDIDALAKGPIQMAASPVLANPGSSVVDASHWRTAIILIVALLLSILLITQFGKAVGLGNGAEVVFSRARQLLHDAEWENRNVRPLPLSLAEIQLYSKLA
ncbi:MAG: hypothetical protein JO166_09275 [Deltaproteobacteria bacterium]|nr:hypothetical protein [Deltaproteobacteria bacterium]